MNRSLVGFVMGLLVASVRAQCPSCVVPPDLSGETTSPEPVLVIPQNEPLNLTSEPDEAGKQDDSARGGLRGLSRSNAKASRVHISFLASSRPSDRLEFGGSVDYPLGSPRLYATANIVNESNRWPSVRFGAVNTLAVNDFETRGMFTPSRTTLWALASKGLFQRSRLRVSAGFARTWQDGTLHPLFTLDIAAHPRGHLYAMYFAGNVSPGASLRLLRSLWLRGNYLTNRREIVLQTQWRSLPNFDF